MKINREQFIQDLEIVSKALGTSGFVLSFQCFRIQGNVLYATDGATSIKRTVEYDTGIDCAIFGLPLLNTLRSIKDETIKIRERDGNLLVETKKIEGTFNVVEDASKMSIPSYGKAKGKNLGTSFVEALSSCKFAVSRDETKGCLCGVLVGEKYIYATDGHRAIRYSVGNNCGADGLVFPIKVVEVLEELCEGKEKIEVIEKEEKVIIHFPNTVLESSTLSGRFPAIDEIFEGRKDLLEIKFSTDVSDVVERHITFQKGVMDIDRFTTIDLGEGSAFFSTTDPVVGNLDEEVEVDFTHDEDISFSINPIFLHKVLKEGNKLEYSPSGKLIKISSNKFEYLAMTKIGVV